MACDILAYLGKISTPAYTLHVPGPPPRHAPLRHKTRIAYLDSIFWGVDYFNLLIADIQVRTAALFICVTLNVFSRSSAHLFRPSPKAPPSRVRNWLRNIARTAFAFIGKGQEEDRQLVQTNANDAETGLEG